MTGVYKVDPHWQRCPVKLTEFRTEKEAISFCNLYDWQVLDADTGLMYDMVIAEEEKSRKRLYYEFIDLLLENARCELPNEDMVQLINDLGVVLDMHFDGIRREVEGEYDEE